MFKETEECHVCGGDGSIRNSFGLTDRCPVCRGTGRRSDDGFGVRDVTKTKASHHARPITAEEKKIRRSTPTSTKGVLLAEEVRSSPHCTDATKDRLVKEIVAYEASHGTCTKTFVNAMRKKLRLHAEE